MPVQHPGRQRREHPAHRGGELAPRRHGRGPVRGQLVGDGGGTARFYAFDPIAGTSAPVWTHQDQVGDGGIVWDADNQRYLVIDVDGNPFSFDPDFRVRQTLRRGLGTHDGGTYRTQGPQGLNITSSCPTAGVGSILALHGTPHGRLALRVGPRTGAAPLPAGPCAGTTTTLDAPALLGLFQLDANGTFDFGGTHVANDCGTILQALDIDTCETSNIRIVR